MKKRACIFDLDGTLVDSMDCWQQMQREYFRKQGVAGAGLDEALEWAKSLPLLLSTAMFIEKFGLPGTPESLSAEMTAIMGRHYREDIAIKPGVREYLAELRAQGAQLCVASATARPLVEGCLERLGIRDRFAFIISCVDVGAGKERPDVFLEAARRLGAAPGETAVFEDSLQAARTAKQAGFYTVGIYDACGEAFWDALQETADETVRDWAAAAAQLRA